MKILVYILSTYLLALSFLPCADGLLQDSENQHTIEQVQTDQDHEQHADHSDDQCSPLCTCACCGVMVPIALKSVWKSNPDLTLIDTYTTYYTFDYSFEYAGGIWHPPAVC